jgi:hypothetical protein
MKNSTKAADVLNDFVDDIVAGRVPRAYTSMAEALGLEVDTLLELIPLFDCVERVDIAARYRPHAELTQSRGNTTLET